MIHYKLAVDPQIRELYPDYQCLVIYAASLNNREIDGYSKSVLRAAEEHARSHFAENALADHEHLRAWHEAFRKFGAKPKRYLCGAEALLQRVLNGSEVPSISPLVDLYNAVSIKHVIPVGGEDWDQLTGDLRLLRAKGDEPFVTFGSEGEQIVYPSPGEIIWADPAGATVRRWNWRQCTRTRITPATQNAYFVFDKLLPFNEEELAKAADELVDHLRRVSPAAKVFTEVLGSND